MTMATEIEGKKISELAERTELTGNEMIPFAEGDANGRVKLDTLKAAVQPDLSGKQVQLVTTMEDIPEEIMPMLDSILAGRAITTEQFQAAKQYLQGMNNTCTVLMSITEGGQAMIGFMSASYMASSDNISCVVSIPHNPTIATQGIYTVASYGNTGEIQIATSINGIIAPTENGISIQMDFIASDGTTYSKSILLKVGGSSGEFLGADGQYHDLETRLSGIEARLAALEGGGTA